MANSTRNQVLLSLPADIRGRILAECTRVDLATGSVLARDGQSTATVYFPETAVISTLATYRNGSVIEMANIGREACTGINLVLGNTTQFATDEVQVGGAALSLPAECFCELMAKLPAFERALFSTVQAVFYQVMVSGACNGIHGTKQRLARWFLTMQDRNDGAEMHLTHEFLADILGVRRATVSEAAAQLQEAGCIVYTRGRVRITDRAKLESASCECYRRVREANGSLLPQRDAKS